MASYDKSLSIDQIFDQTYMLMGDLLQRTGQTDKLIEFLNQGIDVFTKINNPGATAQLLSFLNVVLANQGDLEGAAAANLRTLELLPNNAARCATWPSSGATRAIWRRRWIGPTRPWLPPTRRGGRAQNRSPVARRTLPAPRAD